MTYLEILKNDNVIDHLIVNDQLFDWKSLVDEVDKNTKSFKTRYELVYDTDFSQYISNELKELIQNRNNIDFNDVQVKIITKNEYRQFNTTNDNEFSFIEYLTESKSKADKVTRITKELLENNGFEDITKDYEAKYHKDHEGLEDYKTYRIWTDKFDKNPGKVLKLDFDNGLTNSGRSWHLHIDNCDCCSIGSADLDTVWEFNKLMEVFNSKFRLK